jgi:hypothetical protein
MKNYYDDFDGFNNRRHREVVSKKNKYEDEEDLDDLHIIADDISEKYLSTYGIHNITASTAKNAVVLYVDEMSDVSNEIQKEIKDMAKPYTAIFKESKLKSDKQHLEDIIKN